MRTSSSPARARMRVPRGGDRLHPAVRPPPGDHPGVAGDARNPGQHRLGGRRQRAPCAPRSCRRAAGARPRPGRCRPSAAPGSRPAGSRSAPAAGAPRPPRPPPGPNPRPLPAPRRAGGTRPGSETARAGVRGTCARPRTGSRLPAPCPSPRPARTSFSISPAPGWRRAGVARRLRCSAATSSRPTEASGLAPSAGRMWLSSAPR